MATIDALTPFPRGATVQLSADVGVFADKTQAYVCDYYYQGTTLRVVVRVPDDGEQSSCDLDLAVSGIEALGTP